jgi:CheY-like chemotaxis protein
VALTAATTEADVKRCFDVGMDEVCSKPISRQRLIAKLLQWRNAHMARGLIEVS